MRRRRRWRRQARRGVACPEVAPDPAGDALECGGGLRDAIDERPDVDQTFLHIELDLDACGPSIVGECAAVVEEDLGGPDQDEQRWEPGRVGEDGRDEREPEVVASVCLGALRASAVAVSIGSSPARLVTASAVRVRSSQGESSTAPAESGSPRSRRLSRREVARPPPAESPARTTSTGPVPSFNSAR